MRHILRLHAVAPFVYKCFVPGVAQWLSSLKLSVLSRIILISITNLPKNIASTPWMPQLWRNKWVGGCQNIGINIKKTLTIIQCPCTCQCIHVSVPPFPFNLPPLFCLAHLWQALSAPCHQLCGPLIKYHHCYFILAMYMLL